MIATARTHAEAIRYAHQYTSRTGFRTRVRRLRGFDAFFERLTGARWCIELAPRPPLIPRPSCTGFGYTHIDQIPPKV